MIILGAVTLAVSIVSWKHFSVIPTIYTTRLTALWNLARPDRFLYAIGHSLAGCVCGWCATNLIKGRYMNLTVSCASDSDALCLNEYHLFLVCYGAFVGFVYGVCFFYRRDYWMGFPHIQQPRFFQIKHRMIVIIQRAARRSFRQLRYFYLIYFFLGGVPKGWILRALGLSEKISLTSLWGITDLALLWQTFLLGSFINMAWLFGVLFFKVYNTQSYVFPIESVMESDINCCLHNALACSKQPLVQYLAFHDLCQLSKYSQERRKQVFSLSQPGGHPHNLNNIVKECLSVIKDMSLTLTEFNNEHSSSCMRQVPDRIQLMSPKGIPSAPKDAVPHNYLDKLLAALKKHPLAEFFLAEIAYMQSRKLFANAQLQIWASDALTALVVASYSEDEYGVVQQWLPDILASLLTLQEAVDKHFKLTTSIWKKPTLTSTDSGLVLLRLSLRQNLKSSIYRITAKFKDHLHDISLGSEHHRRLNFFLENKE
ncbi:nucleoporin NDC1-like isoform X2 [Tubulanus polymorphus]